MTTITDVKTRLSVLQTKIIGITRAYAAAPKNLSDLPAFVNFATSATYMDSGSEQVFEMRTYLMRLHVCQNQQGIDGEAEALVEPYIRRVWEFFSARPALGSGGLAGITTRLEPLEEIQGAVIQSDSGIAVFSFAGQEYLGVEFRMNVTALLKRTYADYE